LLRSAFKDQSRPDNTLWALKDVSFNIAEGEVVGIIGRNGAGKSTLLKVLSKITHPTSGRMKVKGRVASLLEVGTGFHEELTGRENIFLNGSILGMKKGEVISKLDSIISYAGVERFVDTPIKRYSSGMRLRLGFAVAAHLDPDVLIVDEVLAVGDAGFQKKCLDSMEEMRSGGRTVLFVSHNMAAVENLCTRGIWIDGGRVRQDGPTREVIESYMSTFADAQQSADLSQVHSSRRGSGEIRYTAIEFLGAGGQPQSLIRSGDRLLMRFYFEAKQTVLRPSFGFRLFTEMGTLVTETSTWHHALHIHEVAPGKGYIDLEIDSLNLVASRYVMSLWLTGDAGHIFDGLEHCVKLEVEDTDVYSSGKNLDSRFGITYFPQRWHLHGIAHDKGSSKSQEVSQLEQAETGGGSR